MNIYLRLERPEDYRESEEVMKEAFWNHYTPGCNEHYLLHIMRDSPNFVPKLDYVAISEGKIVGIIVFLKSFILADDGSKERGIEHGSNSCFAAIPTHGHRQETDNTYLRFGNSNGISRYFIVR